MSETWFPISSLPEGRRVLLFFREGEKGNGEVSSAMVFFNGSDNVRKWTFWTWGGPNSGSDWRRCEKPTHWMPVPPGPDGISSC